MYKLGFNNELYVEKQSEKILERINAFGGKLYLEFGGKMFDDYHASRVLPGFQPDAKVKLLSKLKDQMEIIICISAPDIERKKIRADFGITYDVDLLRLIDSLRGMDLYVGAIVITQYEHQPSAKIFKNKLTNRGERVYIHKKTKGYPVDVDTIVSEEGYGQNPFVETSRPLVVVTAPGPGSGKLATCLSQLYHENLRGNHAGYAKFETFPVWNLPLKHPVNLAYEAATVDLNDQNMIDHFHLQAYGQTTVNYNRDIEVFPVVKNILEKISGKECPYKSPTDMGVNMLGFFITDDDACQEAARQEIIRRYFKTMCDFKQGLVEDSAAQKIQLLMKEVKLLPEDRYVVRFAREKSEKSGKPAVAIQLPKGEIITGRETTLFSASASCVLNAIKRMSDIRDDINLLSPAVIEPIIELKKRVKANCIKLDLEETLIALSICKATNTMAEYALTKLEDLKNCEAHSTVMLQPEDESTMRSLKVQMTCEPEYPTKNWFN
ncbi:MAG: DUF1846 domain-containing protein [Clostridia bacterium]